LDFAQVGGTASVVSPQVHSMALPASFGKMAEVILPAPAPGIGPVNKQNGHFVPLYLWYSGLNV